MPGPIAVLDAIPFDAIALDRAPTDESIALAFEAARASASDQADR
jgi:hypothetical protein